MPAASLEKRNAKSGDRELVFTHVFNAHVGIVFDLWTNPEHLPHWYGPHRFTTTIHELDLRPGGTWRLTMHGPDGRDYHNRLVFLEVDRPHRLVYKHEPEPGSEPVNFEVAVTFVNEGGRTRLSLRMHFPTPADREFVLNTYHADEGGWEILSRLADHLDSMVFIMRVGENDNAPRFEVRITVTLIENGQAQTELTLDILVLSANDAARTNLAGARIGWSQTLDRLAMMLESSSGRGK